MINWNMHTVLDGSHSERCIDCGRPVQHPICTGYMHDAIIDAVACERPFYWLHSRKPHGMLRMSVWRAMILH